MDDKTKRMTTAFGRPVNDDQNSLTAGDHGPVLLQDVHLAEKLAHFDRERIPERVVHAKGAGAYGYFEVTADVTKYTRAKFLSEVGKRTEVFARFSTVGGETRLGRRRARPPRFRPQVLHRRGQLSTWWATTPPSSLSGTRSSSPTSSTPRSGIRQTNLKDPDMFWDFLS